MNLSRTTTNRFRAAALVLTAALSLGGCAASGTGASSSPSASADTVTVDNCGRTLTFDQIPSRVVILSGTSVAEVNSFLALGLGDRIIANMQSYGASDDPALPDEIAQLPTGGLSVNENYDVPAEQLLALQPDLVVSTWSGGFDASMGFATRDELAAAGANTLVTPANCANGDPDATDEEKAAYENANVEDSFDYLRLLGRIFHVEDTAEQVIAGLQDTLDGVTAAIGDEQDVTGVLVSPGPSLNNDGAPVVWTGGLYDDVLSRAGVDNVFAGEGNASSGLITAEQLAATDVDVLVMWGTADFDLDAEAAKVFAEYPQWTAAKENRYVVVYDGVYLGPTTPLAIEKIARVAHPDAF